MIKMIMSRSKAWAGALAMGVVMTAFKVTEDQFGIDLGFVSETVLSMLAGWVVVERAPKNV